MTDALTFYFDYTCPYCYRALRWLRQVEAAEHPLSIQWKTFPLKEVNRPGEAGSIFAADAPHGVALTALELAKAAQAAGPEIFARYHAAAYDAMQGEHRRVTREDLLGIAAAAGLETVRFEQEQRENRWRDAVAADYREGQEAWNVFGTPTIVFGDTGAVYLKFAAVPDPGDSVDLYRSLATLIRCHPELVEIKYPRPA